MSIDLRVDPNAADVTESRRAPLQTLPPPILEHLCDLAVEVGPALDIGITPAGRRRVVPILGGRVGGPLGSGRILPGGADWQLVLGATTAQLDARYLLELDDGALIEVHNRALRVASPTDTAALLRGEMVDAAAVYFRCQPRLATAAADRAWLHEVQLVGCGRRLPSLVHLSFFVVR